MSVSHSSTEQDLNQLLGSHLTPRTKIDKTSDFSLTIGQEVYKHLHQINAVVTTDQKQLKEFKMNTSTTSGSSQVESNRQIVK